MVYIQSVIFSFAKKNEALLHVNTFEIVPRVKDVPEVESPKSKKKFEEVEVEEKRKDNKNPPTPALNP